MKKMLLTDPTNWAAFVGRLTLAFVIFPHGAQKLFGWFGGYGFEGTMGYLTIQQNVPWIIGFLVIIIESIGSLCLLVGFATRFFAFALLCNFIGIIANTHLRNGFFMNWNMMPDQPEGYEYHLLVLGLCIILMITGGGKWSVDAALFNRGGYRNVPVT
jgi:putative oxidoreductase